MTQDRDFSVPPGGEIVSDSRCFVCGQKNVGGLRIRFYRDGDTGARATCEPERTFTGYDGLLHGGISSALLDEIMIKAVLAQGRIVVTARMTTNYHKPVPIGARIELEGRLVRQRGRLFETEGWIRDARGEVLVSAVGSYIELTGERRRRLASSIGALEER